MVGEFKDDALQYHTHTTKINVGVGYQGGTARVTVASSGSGEFSYTSNIGQSARLGDTTRGKRKGVKYIIKVL